MNTRVKFWLPITLIAVILFLFSWLRIHQIDQSLFFFGDIGRDFYTLQKWQESGVPPLLGPQTSALPFNQSAVYFYVLYPFFLIYHQSPFATFFASFLIHISIFVIGVIIVRRRPALLKIWLLSWLILSIHPQLVLQHRYIWNPSFVSVCLLSGFILWRMYLEQKKPWQLVGWAGFLALATAFSYSALPVVAAYFIIVAWKYRSDLLPFLGVTLASLLVVNAPTLAFEARHQFALTRLLIYGEKLPQLAATLPDKVSALAEFVLVTPSSASLVMLLVLFILIALYLTIHPPKSPNTLLSDTGWLFISALLLTLMLPISLQAHYIFGLVTMGTLMIAALPWRWAAVVCLVLGSIWLAPAQINRYFQPVFRSPSATEACAVRVCQQLDYPVFISVQPGYEPHHNHAGLEYRFLLKKAGCQVFDVETQSLQANHMVVFADNSQYEHGKTAYNELTQFGPAEEVDSITCTAPITAHLLRRTQAIP